MQAIYDWSKSPVCKKKYRALNDCVKQAVAVCGRAEVPVLETRDNELHGRRNAQIQAPLCPYLSKLIIMITPVTLGSLCHLSTRSTCRASRARHVKRVES